MDPLEVRVGERVIMCERVPVDLVCPDDGEPIGTVQSIISPTRVAVLFDGEDRNRKVDPDTLASAD